MGIRSQPNKPKPTAIGAGRCAVAVHAASRHWLSFWSLGIVRAKRLSAIIAILVVGIFCQGCVVFPYPTPEVCGSVVDVATKKPISDVRIAVRNHSSIHCASAADGSFVLPAGSRWGFCFLMPGDYLVMADVCFKADDYQSVTHRYCGGMGIGRPVILEHPVELQKAKRP